MAIILPKKIEPLSPTKDTPLFFLAGPIRGGGDWQAGLAERILAKNSFANVACPCRWTSDHRLKRYFYKPFGDAENRQLVWERHYLYQAGVDYRSSHGCVIFWLGLESKDNPHPGPEPYAMDTRREIGKFTAYAEVKRGVRMVVGGDPDFFGLDVIRFELDEAFGFKVPFYTDPDELVDAAYRFAA